MTENDSESAAYGCFILILVIIASFIFGFEVGGMTSDAAIDGGIITSMKYDAKSTQYKYIYDTTQGGFKSNTKFNVGDCIAIKKK